MGRGVADEYAKLNAEIPFFSASRYRHPYNILFCLNNIELHSARPVLAYMLPFFRINQLAALPLKKIYGCKKAGFLFPGDHVFSCFGAVARSIFAG